MAIQSVPSTAPASAERSTTTSLSVGPWRFNVGIGDGDLSSEEMRQVARALIKASVCTTDEDRRIAAELASNMAIAMLDAADASESLR